MQFWEIEGASARFPPQSESFSSPPFPCVDLPKVKAVCGCSGDSQGGSAPKTAGTRRRSSRPIVAAFQRVTRRVPQGSHLTSPSSRDSTEYLYRYNTTSCGVFHKISDRCDIRGTDVVRRRVDPSESERTCNGDHLDATARRLLNLRLKPRV